MPVLVGCGDRDRDNGSAEELVAALPDARLATVPGTHMSSVTESAMGEAIAAFLSDRRRGLTLTRARGKLRPQRLSRASTTQRIAPTANYYLAAVVCGGS